LGGEVGAGKSGGARRKGTDYPIKHLKQEFVEVCRVLKSGGEAKTPREE